MAPSESQTHKLISLYRSCECLWNPQSPNYQNGSVQDLAWRKITRGMNSGLTPDQVKLRVLALRNYYETECAAMRRSQQQGYRHVPRQPYFKDLLFLGDVQSGETEESKASFCKGQLNCILEDSFILSDKDSTKTDIPQNYSQVTFRKHSASSSNQSNESKPGYTLYKLIVEPERPSPSREGEMGELGGMSTERTASGTDHWYPTTYCVRCNRSCSESESCSSMACRPHRKYCSCSSFSWSDVSCHKYCPWRPLCNQNRNLDGWPGPKLCGQTPCNETPKCRGVIRGTCGDKPFCVDSWRRNNDAICDRLQAQMVRLRALSEDETCRIPRRSCSGMDQIKESPRNGNPQSTSCHSPMDLNNNQQIPDAGRYSQACPDSGIYNNNQQVPNPGPYSNNQQMQDPGRYSSEQQEKQIYLDCACAYPTKAGQTSYYQQFAQTPTNLGYSTGMPPGQQYVEAEYVSCPYRGPSYPKQPTIICYDPEDPRTWPQPQHPEQMPMMPPAPTSDLQENRASPNFRAPYASAGPMEMNNRYPTDHRSYPEQQPTVRRQQQESDLEGYPGYQRDQKWEPADDPRERPTRRRYQSQCRSNGDEQEIQRGRRSDRRQYREDGWEDRVTRNRDFDYREGAVRRIREYDDESPTRGERRQHNCSVRSDYEESPPGRRQRNDYEAGPAKRRQRNDYEESPPGRRQRNDYDGCSADSEYDNSTQRRRTCCDNTEESTKRSSETRSPPPERRKRRQDDVAPLDAENYQSCGQPMEQKISKVFQLCSDELQQVGYSAYNRESPMESSNSKYRQQDRGKQDQCQHDREERIAKKTRPPSRNLEYEDDEKPSSRSRGGPPPEELKSEDNKISSAKFKNRPYEETKKPKRRKECYNCCCKWTSRNDKDRSGPTNRQDPDVESGLTTELIYTCNLCSKCPCIGKTISELEAIQKDSNRPTREPTKRNIKERYDDEREPKKSYRNDDNNYDQRRNRKYDRKYDEGPESPRRDDRNESYKYNERAQRGYPRERTAENIPDDDYDGYDDYIANRGNKNMYGCCPHCGCYMEKRNRNSRGREESPRNNTKNKDGQDSAYSIERSNRNSRRREESLRNSSKNKDCQDCTCSIERSNRNSRRRVESPRNSPNNKDYQDCDCREREETPRNGERSSKRTSSPKRNDDKVAPRKPSQKTKGTDVYKSDNDYPSCSCKKEDRNSPQTGRNDNDRKKDYAQERPMESQNYVYPTSSKKKTDTSLESKKKDYEQERSMESPTQVGSKKNTSTPLGSRRYSNDQNNIDAASKGSPQRAECDCDKEGNDNSKKPNETSSNDCNCELLCEPFSPQKPKRNPAGNGNFTLNEDIVKPPSKSYSDYIPRVVNATTAEQAPPRKKKKPKPEGSGLSKNPLRSSKPKTTCGSPTRISMPSKTQAVEPTKRRAAARTGASPSPIGRRIAPFGAKRTTDPCSAANSKLPFDLNSASYFTCKLQDDGNTQRYLVVVPKEPTGREGWHRGGPGQGSVKQLHCQRQCSGFQSVSWVNPSPACQLRPLRPMEDPPPVTDTTLLIVKDYLQGNPALQTTVPPQRMLKAVLSGPMRRRPVFRPSNKAILAENRTVLLTNNPFENLSKADNKEEVIVLHPPVPGFRSSKNSFSTDAVEVERLTVRSSGTVVNSRPTPAGPLRPPRPPTKPKPKQLR